MARALLSSPDQSYLQDQIPPELILQIFSLVNPAQVLKYKQLCKYINQCLSGARFAVLNLSVYLGPSGLACRSKQELAQLDKRWLVWPPCYQAQYAKIRLSSSYQLNWPCQNLCGSIPSAIGQLRHLSLLHLEHNALTGKIPAELGLLTNLLDINLSHNSLSGEIPQELGKLINLKMLSLSNNALWGSIPETLGSISQLHFLSLGENQLTGQFPVSLCVGLSNLHILALDSNKLSGSIPREFGCMQSLQYFSAAYNELSGEIPVEIGNLKHLSMLLLNNNNLSGPIPGSVVGMMRKLKMWNLAGNQF